MARPRIMLCGDFVWAHEEAKQILGPVADIIPMDSPNRADFCAGFKLGGKYHGIVGIYRHFGLSAQLGNIDAELVDAISPSVRWIASIGAGYDTIDVAACKDKGIMVSNTPGSVDEATATTALYLIISALRQYNRANENIRAGKWKTGLKPAHDLSMKTMVILGLGGIGLRLAELVRPYPMRILYHNRNKRNDIPEWCEYVPADKLEEVLQQTDVLSVHVPLRKETEGYVSEKMIRSLKKGSVIVNTARGKVIDEEAMIRALEDGHLSAVGLDVFPNEPAVNPRLFEFPQATLLPHMGTETEESQRSMEVRALGNLRDYLTKGMGQDLIPEMK